MNKTPKKPAVLPPPRRGKDTMTTLKVLVVGDAAVGKTNVMTRFASNTFDLRSVATIGVEFVTREVDVSGNTEGGFQSQTPEETTSPSPSPSSSSGRGKGTGNGKEGKVKLQIWDTAGQERCSMISTAFYRNAKGVIIVYDVTRRETLLNVPRWVAHAKQYADPNCVFMVVGNKLDLTNLRQVSEEDAEEICHPLDVRHYYASALTGDGVPSVFFQLSLAMHAVALEAADHQSATVVDHSAKNGSGSKTVEYSSGGHPPQERSNNKPDFSVSGGDTNSYTGLDPYRIQLQHPVHDGGRGHSGGTKRRKENCCG